ncbi:hypothetical protein BaRGS_00008899 [Batillaria attramentaria]|uniref:Activation-induced cytidine deaminase AID domain-containing protein n=1 Tax=Batillaria attramentaria TaxID=370345 RepID=A0ABD0LK75_9CAEN
MSVTMNMSEIYSLFVRSGLVHEGGVPNIKDCFADVSVTSNWQRVFHVLEKNFAGKHVEERLIYSLHEYFIRRSRHLEASNAHVTIMINFSPCYDCSDKFVRFIREMRQNGILLSMEIVFPFLYKIRRPWCRQNCKDKHLPSTDDHARSMNGLYKLKEQGIRLRPFERSDWIRLADILNVPRFMYYRSAREKEDRLMKYDCDALGLTEGAGFGGASTLLRAPVQSSFARRVPSFSSDKDLYLLSRGQGFKSVPSFSFVPGHANTFSSISAGAWPGAAVQNARTTALYTDISNTGPATAPGRVTDNTATMAENRVYFPSVCASQQCSGFA